MAGDMNLMKEMKKVRRNGSDDLQSVEGVENKDVITEKFKEVYKALYNSAETTTYTLQQTMRGLIEKQSMCDVDKIIGDSVKAATVKI